MFLKEQLNIKRCPYCSVSMPTISKSWSTTTTNHSKENLRGWVIYQCSTCGGLITAGGSLAGNFHTTTISEIYPRQVEADEAIPDTARNYLDQAIASLHAPAGAVMLAAASVDAMLKSIGYSDGSLYNRINKAKDEHKITLEMAEWAHEIRLDANDQRHADEEATLPLEKDAQKCIHFTIALGEFLFVLPARVERGRKEE